MLEVIIITYVRNAVVVVHAQFFPFFFFPFATTRVIYNRITIHYRLVSIYTHFSVAQLFSRSTSRLNVPFRSVCSDVQTWLRGNIAQGYKTKIRRIIDAVIGHLVAHHSCGWQTTWMCFLPSEITSESFIRPSAVWHYFMYWRLVNVCNALVTAKAHNDASRFHIHSAHRLLCKLAVSKPKTFLKNFHSLTRFTRWLYWCHCWSRSQPYTECASIETKSVLHR